MSDTDDTPYPEGVRPLYPDALKGVATVKGAPGTNLVYKVNFNTGECDCQHGAAWHWDGKRWVMGRLCDHKLKAIASKLERDPDDDLYDFYEQEVGKRNNAFIAVSAMHKELRRGDAEKALYWATVMIAHRGVAGVINYLRNILFEETRDLPLGRFILKLSEQGRNCSRLDMNRAIRRFAAAPKKWQLPWRLEIFVDEMKGYRELATLYGYEVARAKDIIAESERPSLTADLIGGFKKGNRAQVQQGLKGLFKMKTKDHDKHKIGMFNMLVDIMNGDFPNKFEPDHDSVRAMYDFVMRRTKMHGTPGYHELNAFCDALTGEPVNDPASTLTSIQHKKHVGFPRVYRLPLGELRRIPIYAHDNHTWPGKAAMNKWGPTELQPGAVQEHIDFRYWGAYGGVAWRYLAWRQHSTIDCKWGDVSWKTPNWLWGHVEKMNY